MTAKGRAIAQLDEKLQKTLAQKSKVESELKLTKSEIDEVMKVITKLGTETLRLEAELTTTLAQMGCKERKASRDNYQTYMGLIEQRINELCNGQSFLQESNEVPDMIDPETLNEQFRK